MKRCSYLREWVSRSIFSVPLLIAPVNTAISLETSKHLAYGVVAAHVAKKWREFFFIPVVYDTVSTIVPGSVQNKNWASSTLFAEVDDILSNITKRCADRRSHGSSVD